MITNLVTLNISPIQNQIKIKIYLKKYVNYHAKVFFFVIRNPEICTKLGPLGKCLFQKPLSTVLGGESARKKDISLESILLASTNCCSYFSLLTLYHTLI